MNNRYFACSSCRRHTEAGYRWAYWTLEEPAVVALGRAVDADAVRQAAAYWDADGDAWVRGVLAVVRRFLADHENHDLQYVEDDYIFEQWQLGYEWREIKSPIE